MFCLHLNTYTEDITVYWNDKILSTMEKQNLFMTNSFQLSTFMNK